MSIPITTDRLIIRHWRNEDTEPFITLNQDAYVMRYFPSTLTAAETHQQLERIQSHFALHSYGLYALERRDNGAFIGYTGFAHPRFEAWFTPCVEIGWRLNKENHGQGFATEAALACLDYGFSELKFSDIHSFTAAVNLPSVRVMQKAGMQPIGRFEHPVLPEGHWLRTHELYKISAKNTTLK